MTDELSVDLFCEDRAHRELIGALLLRMGNDISCELDVRVVSARAGRGRVFAAFTSYQEIVERVRADEETPDIVVAAIDGNCASFAETRKTIQSATRPKFDGRVVAACPDPHIERWYMADLQAFKKVVGLGPDLIKEKCEQDYYKRVLTDTIRRAGHLPPLGGIDFAPELAEEMDFYRASKNDASFRSFVDEFRGALQRCMG